MKITLSQLRRIIREALEEEAWPPGRWYPGTGESVSDEEMDTVGRGGMGLKDVEEEENGFALGEAKKKRSGSKGLWANIKAKRDRGKPPAKPGEEGYPKTLDI